MPSSDPPRRRRARRPAPKRLNNKKVALDAVAGVVCALLYAFIEVREVNPYVAIVLLALTGWFATHLVYSSAWAWQWPSLLRRSVYFAIVLVCAFIWHESSRGLEVTIESLIVTDTNSISGPVLAIPPTNVAVPAALMVVSIVNHGGPTTVNEFRVRAVLRNAIAIEAVRLELPKEVLGRKMGTGSGIDDKAATTIIEKRGLLRGWLLVEWHELLGRSGWPDGTTLELVVSDVTNASTSTSVAMTTFGERMKFPGLDP